MLRKLDGGTAPGIDGIPTRLYKKFSSLFMPIFILLFNSVLSSGIWVSGWKTSLILPLFKKGIRSCIATISL